MVEKNGKFTATTPLRSGFGQIDHGFPLVERVAIGLVRAAPLSADVGDHEIGLLDHVAIPVRDGIFWRNTLQLGVQDEIVARGRFC